MTEPEYFPQHECGIFGVHGHPNAAVLTYYGLFALQHRGQESAGIVTSDGAGTSFQMHRDMGLVSQVFGAEELEQLKGTRAVGHTRYSTTGSSTLKNAQPFVVEYFREIEPGEVLIISDEGIRSEWPFRDESPAFCMFEYVYFSRPDSIVGGINVAKVRTQMGRELTRRFPAHADLVVPVPDSGNYAALGFAQELKIPYEHAFVRNHYIGRTFLQPSQLIRDFDVRVKLNLIKEAVAGKRVVVVDDSIVRGTTARARVVNMREAGAKEVHMRISCPPHKHACHYGIDFPDPEKLLANQCTLEEIRDYLEADSIGYLDVPGM